MGDDTPRRANGRIDFARAGELIRRALFAANRLAMENALTPFDHRVLTAVVAFTGSYSRRGDRVYVAQLAAFAYGTDHAEPWKVEKTRKALIRLAERGLIERRAPIGRPNEGTAGPAYWVALLPERQPEPGPTSEEERQPGAGPTFQQERQPGASRKGSPGPAGKAASSQPERQPGASPPTEKSPGEVLPGEDFEKTARSHVATTPAGDRAAELLTSLAPVALDPEQIAREARRVVELAGQHVDVGVLLEALDERDEPGTPAEILTWFADWIFFEGDSPSEEATGTALRAIAEVFPVATVIADACTVTSGKPWTAHFDEAVRLAQHWQRHAYPEAITATVLDEIRHDGIRHPGDADELARQAILELGTTLPKKFARALASARKTA